MGMLKVPADELKTNVVFVCFPCMAINVRVKHNGGFLPDITLLTQRYYHRGTATVHRVLEKNLKRKKTHVIENK